MQGGRRPLRAHTIQAEPLTSSSFESFGFVIENPSNADTIGSIANQGTAVKYANISLLRSSYSNAPQHVQAESAISLYVCSPRPLMPSGDVACAGIYELSLMERHPYTTQTFVPMGLDPSDQRSAYLTIVAPTTTTMAGMPIPDHAGMKAFVCRGSQAVTYATGVWHAPMVVIGSRSLSFVVIQYVNGIEADDCREVTIERTEVSVPCGTGLFSING